MVKKRLQTISPLWHTKLYIVIMTLMDFHKFPLFPILGAYLLPKRQNNQNNCFTFTNWMKPLSSLTSKGPFVQKSSHSFDFLTYTLPKRSKEQECMHVNYKKIAWFLRDDHVNLQQKIKKKQLFTSSLVAPSGHDRGLWPDPPSDRPMTPVKTRRRSALLLSRWPSRWKISQRENFWWTRHFFSQ